MVWVALSPSLLPRTWWMTAVNVGLGAAFGYALGRVCQAAAQAAARLVRLRVELDDRGRVWIRRGWYAVLALLTVASWRGALLEQARIARLVGGEPQTAASQAVGLLAGAVLFLLLLGLARALRLAWLGLRRLVDPLLPRVLVSGAVAATVLAAVLYASNQVLYNQLLDRALTAAAAANAQPLPGRTQPQLPQRSGSPASPEPWESLGAQGQAFVSDGPLGRDIAVVVGRPALEPIRVYAGRVPGRDLEATADAVAAELERTGAFDRSVLHVTTPTGTGWVQEWSAQSVEYLAGGDVATASMQYSYFPSALAYVADRSTPARAGRALFDAVSERLHELPAHQRPRLVVSGESLGSYGGQAAFASPQDLLASVDGAVWTGTPRFTPLWQQLTAARRQGSPEIAPVIHNGRHIRFVTRPEELHHDFYGAPYEPWRQPRVVYVQHASDPVVWWSPDLLTQQPDWMREMVGRDVTPGMAWAPWVTFWQVASDLPLSTSTVGGHGHSYREELVPVWAAVLRLDPAADHSAVQRAIGRSLVPH